MADGVEPLQITASAQPRDVTEIRHALRSWLETLPGAFPVERIAHAVGEAVTNVVEHAYVDTEDAELAGRVDVDAHYEVRHLVIRVRDYGSWRDRSAPESRGMLLIETLADDVRVSRTDTGSEVRMRWDGTR